jgi:hypothetical protein
MPNSYPGKPPILQKEGRGVPVEKGRMTVDSSAFAPSFLTDER